MNGILENEEREQLIPEIADFTEGRPKKLITLIPRNHVIRIPTDPVPEMYAYQVVRYCEMSAWVEDPALIIKLLKRFNHRVIFSNAINRLKSGAPNKFYSDNRVWDACLLALDLPFLNRTATRQAIEYFSYPLLATLKPAGLRVLIVNGPDKSGKSFTYDYILYVNSIFAKLNFNTIWVDFKKQVMSRFGPIELIENLLDQVNPKWENEGVILPVLDAQQPARWMLELVRVLVDQINNLILSNNALTHVFIVLDGFDDLKVTRETLDLIQIIAAVAVGKELSIEGNDLIRLVLLGFPDAISNYRNRVKVDNIQPIERIDIELYFKHYAKFKGKTLDNAALDAMVNAVKIEEMNGVEYRTKQIAQKALQIAKACF